jgi:hypothetical protein
MGLFDDDRLFVFSSDSRSSISWLGNKVLGLSESSIGSVFYSS